MYIQAKQMAMLLLMILLFLMTGQYSEAQDEPEEPILPPLLLNCTQQGLTDFLLLRQETQLSRISAAEEATTKLLEATLETLVQVRDSLNEMNAKMHGKTVKNLDVVCHAPFTQVGGSCFLLALQEKHTWASARQFCAGYGAELAHFSDANMFAAILGYVNTINFQKKAINVWVGGTDEAVEDTWLWVTGELMPRGPPFWGTYDGYALQPNAGTSQNCAVLWQHDYYYMHDLPCTHKCAPLCQK
ncbi:type-2 ice-structuring protein-like isoform X3 [Penaeus japonicus]|uniref:type-2 ice-structuring protein-like isoform X3 n=1 Tax=Penaeus japonicus TaxID=27405 RepID=UPI001C71774C|nr:type-2 ice-structuring protein-like isoform X3 [Penaeus japonicus]